MADAPVVKKPEALKVQEMPAPVQESLKVDLSYIDKMPRDPKGPSSRKQTLYWYGTLPAVGPIQTWTTDRRNNVIRGEDVTALGAWTHPEKMSEWHGKCQWFQNITIRGLTFPAFTGYSQRSGFESPNQAMSFDITKAGAVGSYTDEEVETFLFEAAHTMIKPATSPRAPHTAEIFRLIEDPPKSGRWIHPDQDPIRAQRGTGYYDPERDKPVADFVYFLKIQNEFQQQDLISIMRNPLPSLSGR